MSEIIGKAISMYKEGQVYTILNIPHQAHDSYGELTLGETASQIVMAVMQDMMSGKIDNNILDYNDLTSSRETESYAEVLKEILDADYGKERVFYESGEWYDRNVSGDVSVKHIIKEVRNVFAFLRETEEFCHVLLSKLAEYMTDEELDELFENLYNGGEN